LRYWLNTQQETMNLAQRAGGFQKPPTLGFLESGAMPYHFATAQRLSKNAVNTG
jgi:hypothetical protein